MALSEPLAHIDTVTGATQSLYDHSLNVSNIAEKYCLELGIPHVGKICGLLHDIGKSSNEFQKYIRGNSDFHRGDVDHSTKGAQIIESFKYEKTEKEAIHMMALAIISHHSGLIDCVDLDGRNNFQRRINKIIPAICEDCEDCSKLLNLSKKHIDLATQELSTLLNSIISDSKQHPDKGKFILGLLERHLLSALMDADHEDTRRFMEGPIEKCEFISWSILSSRLDQYLTEIHNDSPINSIRAKISEECYKAALSPQGLFSLNVPTGGGKTLSSLRFALKHAEHHGLTRIVYIIPYTSIIEQNAKVVRSILEKDNESVILEYHSNVDPCSSTEDSGYWKYYTDTWNVQILFTTMVQYLNTFFASGSGHVKRMHNLSKSVIIFDEIQTVPVKCIYMFNETANYLVKYCGCSAVMCTATQPMLDKISKYPLGKVKEIIGDSHALHEDLKRTEAAMINPLEEWDPTRIAEHIVEGCDLDENILVIVNTKKYAQEIYSVLKTKLPVNYPLYHLSTNMCPAHRSEKFVEIKEQMKSGGTICVSTQLIEAGVDIDFDHVIRMAAGVDSIAQAAGRCNRNGKLDHLGKITIINSNEDLSRLEDIHTGKRCMMDVLRNEKDILSESSMSLYFNYYLRERSKDMDYPVKKLPSTLFELLSNNKDNVNLCKEKEDVRMWVKQAFKTANEEFKVIDWTDSVLVPYNDEAKSLISVLCSENPNNNLIEIFRKLQKYSVNTYNLEDLVKKGMVKCISEKYRIYALIEGYYHGDYGMTYESNNKTMMF